MKASSFSRWVFAVFFSLGAIGLLASAADLIAPDSARPAPVWSAKDLSGKELTSASLQGKVVVVDFWATWCGPCLSEIPGYVELQNRYADKGLVIVGLSVDQAGEDVVRKFAEARHINYPIALADEALQSAFGSFDAIPTTFVIDREGRIRFTKTGAMETAEFEKILQGLL